MLIKLCIKLQEKKNLSWNDKYFIDYIMFFIQNWEYFYLAHLFLCKLPSILRDTDNGKYIYFPFFS